MNKDILADQRCAAGIRLAVALAAMVWASACAAAGDSDWPMWRYDAGHTAASPHELPPTLRPVWSRQYAPRVPVWDDPLNQDLMPYDTLLEPVVAGGRMFVAFNDQDKVAAFDARSGRELWTFYADGPVRFSPVAWGANVYFTSDDGCLYCVDAAQGRLRWRFRGAPAAQKVIGNRRVISAWPARGGPVLRDGTICFAASIWPFMGTFIYALDAESGAVQWVNDSTGSDYVRQPHAAPAFAGVAPQGQLAATADLLLVPGGRSTPAAFDRRTGALRYFTFGPKGQGGSFVAADAGRMFVHTRLRGTAALKLADGSDTKFRLNEPVLADDLTYAANAPGKTKEGQPAPAAVQAFAADKRLVWQIEADGTGDLIRAGSRLYAAGAGNLLAIELPQNPRPARVAWSMPVEGRVERLLAAEGMLFAVTREGRIMAFGAEQGDGKAWTDTPQPLSPSGEVANHAARLLRETDAREGYALWLGADDESLLEAILAASELHVVVVDPDAERVARLRRRFDAAGWYGRRVAAHAGDPLAFQPPRYMASLIVIGRSLAEQLTRQEAAPTVYESLRPYGGRMWVASADVATVAGRLVQAGLAKARVTLTDGAVVVTRVGALPGAADWTHAYGDIANTVKSNDQRVRLPLGLLWFGGNSHRDVLPRHGHGPCPQVVGGRLFIEGMNCLSARDVYTGRVLWRRDFPDLGTFNVYFDDAYADAPLSTTYNQVHIPGANARGTNYVATPEGVYLAVGGRCLQMDVATGRTVREFVLPAAAGQQPRWGFIGVYENLLLAGTGTGDYSKRLGYQYTPAKKRGTAWGPDFNGSLGLMAFDRRTGRTLWKVPATHSFLHNGIVAGGGRIYCIDRLPVRVEDQLRRRGQNLPGARLVALQARSGKVAWQRTANVTGTWLGYSAARDVLLVAGSAATDRSPDETGKGMAVLRGSDGKPLWEKPDLTYAGPCILHHDSIITNATSYKTSQGAYRLGDGTPVTIPHPITGEPVVWNFTRTYGCNTCVASEHLLTFRSGAAGFYDLDNLGGTGNFGGFKSGCTSNLIAADGVLNAPDYTRTCSCPYQNQASLALVHMPEIEMWTYNSYTLDSNSAARIRRLGVNFGAPGDRRAADGVLWIEYPVVGGTSPKVPIEIEGRPGWFRHNSLRVSGTGPAWVAASGVEGVQKVTVWLAPQQAPVATSPPPTYSISQGSDDAEEAEGGKMSLASSDLDMTLAKTPQTIGLRFQGLNIPRGVRVRRAYVQFEVDEPSADATQLVIHAQAADDATAFSTKLFDISARPRTAAAVRWEPKPWTSGAGPDQQTPDLTPLVEEVVQRPGWKDGNSLALIVSGTGRRVAKAFESKQPGPARLVIETEKASTTSAGQSGPLSPKPYTVRLHFVEPEAAARTAEREFSVILQGRTVIERLDPLAEAGGPLRSVVKTFPHVLLADKLTIEFRARSSRPPVLCGVEFAAEE
jgi:outer membrane protein assembly factor BamB